MSDADLTTRWARTLEAANSTHSFTEFAKLVRAHQALLRQGYQPQRRHNIRVALLGTANAQMCAGPIALALECLGVGCEIYCADFGTYAHEILSSDSGLHAFSPDVVQFVNSPLMQPSWPAYDDSDERTAVQAAEVAEYWLGLCRQLNSKFGCVVVFDNFHRLDTRPFGNYASKVPGDANSYLGRLNAELARRAPSFVHINDVDWLASLHGLANWVDARFWHHAKQAVSFHCLVAYARNSARVIGSTHGSPRKVLVLDLDNTLWGGVIGDDGLEGIRIGQGSSQGEAFLAFQRYVQSLRKRGVLLAVCSKNDLQNATLPFTDHPEMVLRLDDFVSFSANWEPKPDNLVAIAAKLNLGIDSFVFIDDNPAERELMRQRLPQVLTLEVGSDPDHFPRILDAAAPFEVTSLSTEDIRRTENYRSNAERERLLTTAGDYQEYLTTLEQRALIGPFRAQRLDRITQLINKTNQFNLTTLRMTRADVDRVVTDSNRITVAVNLADRFGDNGLIGVTIGTVDGKRLIVDAWLMSCRVLKRNVERVVCNYLTEVAKARGLEAIEGAYLPSKRNSLAKDHYANLGFTLVDRAADGSTHWRLEVGSYTPANTTIEVTFDHE